MPFVVSLQQRRDLKIGYAFSLLNLFLSKREAVPLWNHPRDNSLWWGKNKCAARVPSHRETTQQQQEIEDKLIYVWRPIKLQNAFRGPNPIGGKVWPGTRGSRAATQSKIMHFKRSPIQPLAKPYRENCRETPIVSRRTEEILKATRNQNYVLQISEDSRRTQS